MRKRRGFEIDDTTAFVARMNLDRVHAALLALKDGKLSNANNEILEDMIIQLLVEDLDLIADKTIND
jgi:hypothetical protein